MTLEEFKAAKCVRCLLNGECSTRCEVVDLMPIEPEKKRTRHGGRTRGTTNRLHTGSAKDRRKRRQWLLDTFGDGVTAPCVLGGPDVPKCLVTLDIVTLTVDRIVPGCKGGRYVRANIQPACMPCNSRKGGALRSDKP